MPISEQRLERIESPGTVRKAGGFPWLLSLLVLAVVLISGGMFIAGWNRHNRITEQVDAAAERERDTAPMVNVAKVVRAPGDVSILLPGNMTAVTEASIYARATGYVKKRNVDIGDRVKEGQLLAEIDSPEQENQVAQARAAMAQAESMAAQARAQLENQQAQSQLAKVTWDRYRNLQAKGAIAKQDADQQETNFHTSESAVRAAQANVKAADENISASKSNLERLQTLQDYLKVKAPFAGVITARNFDIGALISAAGSSQNMAASGGSELFRLARFDVLRILVNVYQESAVWIKAGQTAEVLVQEFPNRKFLGRITRMANSVDVASRTMLTEVQIPNPDLVLLPGMYAQVRLTRSNSEPSLMVPGDTIVAANQGLQVAVLLDPPAHEGAKPAEGLKRVHFVNVQVGRDNGEQIEVRSGLQGWEYVVINPGDAVQEGALVRPVTAAAKPVNRPKGKGSTPKQ